jgi:hypothetical protein
VEIVNSAVVAPLATVAVSGTAATLGSELRNAMTAPPAWAAALSVTVLIEVAPPTTVPGFRLTEATCDHVIGPVGFQDAPPLVLLYTPPVPSGICLIPAYSVAGVRGSMTRGKKQQKPRQKIGTAPVHVAAASVLLNNAPPHPAELPPPA